MVPTGPLAGRALGLVPPAGGRAGPGEAAEGLALGLPFGDEEVAGAPLPPISSLVLVWYFLPFQVNSFLPALRAAAKAEPNEEAISLYLYLLDFSALLHSERLH